MTSNNDGQLWRGKREPKAWAVVAIVRVTVCVTELSVMGFGAKVAVVFAGSEAGTAVKVTWLVKLPLVGASVRVKVAGVPAVTVVAAVSDVTL
jgi:hypothetical protein